MIVTNEKIEVTHQMLVRNNMVRGDQYGVPVDPKNPSLGLSWKYIALMSDQDFDAIENYFILKRDRG
jgi:hypothetical protein